jgi:hypothetical protein
MQSILTRVALLRPVSSGVAFRRPMTTLPMSMTTTTTTSFASVPIFPVNAPPPMSFDHSWSPPVAMQCDQWSKKKKVNIFYYLFYFLFIYF